MESRPGGPGQVLLIESQPDAHDGLRAALASRPGLGVVGVAAAQATLREIRRYRPDLVCLSVTLSDVAQSGVLRALREVAPDIPLVVLADFGPMAVPGSGARWADRMLAAVSEVDLHTTLEARVELPGERQSVPLARDLVMQMLGPAESRDIVDSATIIVTELVANAVRHASGPCAVELTRRGELLRIAVVDGDPGIPGLQRLDVGALGGRGMHIIAALAFGWGVDALGDGHKLVWADLRPSKGPDEL